MMRRSILASVVAAVVAAPTASASPFRELFENATYEAQAYSAYFTSVIQNQSRAIDDKRLQLWSRFTVETSAAITDELYLDLSAQAVGTNQQDERRGFFTPPGNERPEGRWLDVAEAFLTFEQDDYTITLGKAPMEIGLSTLYSPTDRFEFVDGVNPLHIEGFGVWQGRIDYYFDEDTVSFYVFPWEDRNMSPTGESRWMGSSGDGAFFSITLPGLVAGIPTTITERYRDITPANFAHLLKYAGVREGFDFFVAGHLGPSIYPVLRTTGLPNTFDKETPWAFSPMAGVAATIGAWEVHGETIMQQTFANNDQDFIKYVVGISYRETELANAIGFEEFNPVIEFSQDLVTRPQESRTYIADSSSARPHRESILYRIDLRQSDEWSYRFGGSHNFRDHDSAYAGEIEYKPNDNLTIKLMALFYAGPDDTQFGRWRRNDNIELGIIHNF